MDALYVKLKLQSQMKIKQGVKAHLEEKDIQTIARYMPKTNDELSKLIAEDKCETHSTWILDTTRTHYRDQDQFNECVSEMMAFVRGGGYALQLLSKVYQNIIQHYGMEVDANSVLDACNLYLHPFEQVLKHKRPAE